MPHRTGRFAARFAATMSACVAMALAVAWPATAVADVSTEPTIELRSVAVVAAPRASTDRPRRVKVPFTAAGVAHLGDGQVSIELDTYEAKPDAVDATIHVEFAESYALSATGAFKGRALATLTTVEATYEVPLAVAGMVRRPASPEAPNDVVVAARFVSVEKSRAALLGRIRGVVPDPSTEPPVQ